ncbi:hypothetical protein EVAR_93473_1 [Eumeta japonica]|uniref:Uncharacterized protein n=1 Tax=Eumeta variegata TaxID=151549 RepID=A0A4C1TJ85_EUMVA|nr:hypothetical protein EVAR_93473_1 [Eumeta japonica]
MLSLLNIILKPGGFAECDRNAFRSLQGVRLSKSQNHYGVTGHALDLLASYLTNRVKSMSITRNRLDPWSAWRKKTKCVKISLLNVKNGSGFILIRNEELELVDTSVFLGLTLDNKIQWGPHIAGATVQRSCIHKGNPFALRTSRHLHVSVTCTNFDTRSLYAHIATAADFACVVETLFLKSVLAFRSIDIKLDFNVFKHLFDLRIKSAKAFAQLRHTNTLRHKDRPSFEIEALKAYDERRITIGEVTRD